MKALNFWSVEHQNLKPHFSTNYSIIKKRWTSNKTKKMSGHYDDLKMSNEAVWC